MQVAARAWNRGWSLLGLFWSAWLLVCLVVVPYWALRSVEGMSSADYATLRAADPRVLMTNVGLIALLWGVLSGASLVYAIPAIKAAWRRRS